MRTGSKVAAVMISDIGVHNLHYQRILGTDLRTAIRVFCTTRGRCLFMPHKEIETTDLARVTSVLRLAEPQVGRRTRRRTNRIWTLGRSLAFTSLGPRG